jgi:hypothetical protein
VQGHRGEGYRLLLADREKLVHLAFAGIGADCLGTGYKLVRHAGTRGDHDDKLIAVVADGLDALGDFLDAFDVTDGRAAEFLDDESHGRMR